jgi:hypothetical protein
MEESRVPDSFEGRHAQPRKSVTVLHFDVHKMHGGCGYLSRRGLSTTASSSIPSMRIMMNPGFPLFQQSIAPIEDRMIRSAWWITRNAQDAEDAMQNALMVIWKNRHRIGQHPNPQALIL